MPTGKLAAQAGHAYVGALLSAKDIDPASYNNYISDPPGTKVCLAVRNADELLAIRDIIADQGIPCALIVDEGHVLLPHFDGSPIVTALGVGPATRREVASLKHLRII